MPEGFGLDALVPAPAVATDDARLSARFLLTDRSEDRDGDVVETAGLDWDHHREAPVVYFEHRKVLPFPVALSRTPEGVLDSIIATTRQFGFQGDEFLGDQISFVYIMGKEHQRFFIVASRIGRRARA